MHSIEYFSIDNVNNVGSTLRYEIQVDGTKPSATVFVGNPRYFIGNQNHDIPFEPYLNQKPMYIGDQTEIIIDNNDSESGIWDVEYRFDSSDSWKVFSNTVFGRDVVPNNQTVAFEYRAIDRVRNIYQSIANIFVDNIEPDTNLVFVGPKYVSGSTIYIGPYSHILVNSLDAGSGVKLGTPETHIVGLDANYDNTSFYSYPISFVGLQNGRYRIEHRAMDNIGNIRMFMDKGPNQETVMYDCIRPGAGLTFFTENGSGFPVAHPDGDEYITEDNILFFEGFDIGLNPSGINRIEWRLDDEIEWHSVAHRQHFTLANYAHGYHTIYWRAVDNVENTQMEIHYGPFFLSSRNWPRQMYSNARSGAPELSKVVPPFKVAWKAKGMDRAMLVADWKVFSTFLNGSTYVLRAHSLDDGRHIWTRTLVGETINGITYENAVLVASMSGGSISSDHIRGYRSGNGSLIWTYIPSSNVKMGIPVTAGQNSTAVLSGELDYIIAKEIVSGGHSYLLAIDHTNGVKRWSVTLPFAAIDAHINGITLNTTNGSPAVRDRMVVVSTQGGVCAFDALNGTPIWNYTGYVPILPPVIGKGIITVACKKDSKMGMVALDLQGNYKWYYCVADSTITSSITNSIIDSKNHVIFACNKKMMSLDGETGNLLWFMDVGSMISQPIEANQVIYFVGTMPGDNNMRLWTMQGSPRPESNNYIASWSSLEKTRIVSAMPIVARERLIASTSETVQGISGGALLCFTNNTAGEYRFDLIEPVVAGVSFSMTITAVDALGRIVDSYVETVRSFSDDNLIEMPKYIKYEKKDGGVKYIPSVMFGSSGRMFLGFQTYGGPLIQGVIDFDVLPHPPINVVIEGGNGSASLNWNYPDLPGVLLTLD